MGKTLQSAKISLPPLRGEGQGGDGVPVVSFCLLTAYPHPASPSKGEQHYVWNALTPFTLHPSLFTLHPPSPGLPLYRLRTGARCRDHVRRGVAPFFDRFPVPIDAESRLSGGQRISVF